MKTKTTKPVTWKPETEISVCSRLCGACRSLACVYPTNPSTTKGGN